MDGPLSDSCFLYFHFSSFFKNCDKGLALISLSLLFKAELFKRKKLVSDRIRISVQRKH